MKVAEWVVLNKILEVCYRMMGYKGEGGHCDPWWQQSADRKQFSETLEDILAVSRSRR